MSEPEVLYEDRHLIALNKRPGEPVQPDPSGDASLLDVARSLVGRQPYLVHRLDRPVSGIVLFAAEKRVAGALSQLFQNHEVKKRYWAIVDAAPPADSGTLEHDIVFDNVRNRSRAVGHRPAKHGERVRRARLDYVLIGRSERYWFIEVEPGTGRHHQIRAQLAAVGCHIKGDVKYGARRTNPGGGILLHARSLSFSHPMSGKYLELIAEPPASDGLWQLFEQAAESARPPGIPSPSQRPSTPA